MLTLGQKLKLKKTCQNPYYKSFRVVLCKKPSKKTPNIRELRSFEKSANMYRPMQNPHFGSKIKIRKTCQNPFCKSFSVVLSKKPLEKTPNVREMRPS